MRGVLGENAGAAGASEGASAAASPPPSTDMAERERALFKLGIFNNGESRAGCARGPAGHDRARARQLEEDVGGQVLRTLLLARPSGHWQFLKDVFSGATDSDCGFNTHTHALTLTISGSRAHANALTASHQNLRAGVCVA